MVDYSPALQPYKNPHYFRFWCQKVLPLVYDDSLSYYELLCKVVKYLNDVIADSDTVKENVQALKEAYDQLQAYVNNYFNTLDLQDEVDKKLDEMAEDGTLDHLLNIHLTSGYINVIRAGAFNDGSTPTGEIINGILDQYRDSTIYFPPGVYMIETTLNLYTDYNQRLLLDGATLRAIENVPVIRIDKLSETTESTVETISGQGLIDMNNTATIGISLSDYTRYVTIQDINIENIGNGIGIKAGDNVATSISAVIKNVKVRGTSSENLNSVGIDVYGFDCFISETNIIRCATGMKLRSGGNMLSGIHIWNDSDINSDAWDHGLGIDNQYVDNMMSNIYIDNCYEGIRALQPTLMTNLFYYLPQTAANKTAHIFRCPQNGQVKVTNLYCVKKAGYIIHPFFISNRTQDYLIGANKSFICNATNVYDVDGFQQIDELFNIKNNKYTGTLTKNLQVNTYAETMYLVGYLSKTTGVGNLKLDYGGAFKYNVQINSERVRNIVSGDIVTTLLAGSATGGLDKLIFGVPVTQNNLTVYPVYINLANGFSGYLGVEFDSTGELNFYLASHLNAAQCAYTDAINTLLEIDL